MPLSTIVPASFVTRRLAPDDEIYSLEAVFRRNIASLIGSEPSPGGIEHQRRCGLELDALALDRRRPSGTKELSLALMRLIQPTRTAAAVVSAKNEGCFLLECVAHYRAVGFEHVFLYTNDNSDGSDALLDALDSTRYVTVIRNEVGPLVSPQVKAYEHSIHLLHALRDFEWVSYFDVDEFLVPAEHHDYSVIETITALQKCYPSRLAAASDSTGMEPEQRPSAICYNWNWYGSEGQIRREEGLVQERFSHSVAHGLVKSLVRLADIGTMAAIHVPGPEGLVFVNSAFDPITIGVDCMTEPPDAVHGTLNHYYQKSFEEFGVKSHRGRGGVPGGLEGKGLHTFFEWDVAATPVTYNPVPPRLLARVHAELAALQSIPAIAKAAQLTQKTYCALSQRVNGNDLEAKFNSMRAQFQPAT